MIDETMTNKPGLTELLRQIPLEYQEKFRESLRREAREAEQDKTEKDELAYYRQRLGEFAQGDYLEPDGTPSTEPVNLGQVYEQAMDPIAREVKEGSPERQKERQRLMSTAIILFVMVGVLVGGVFYNWKQKEARAEAATVAEMAALEGLGEETGDGTPAEGLPSPTPPFPIGADDALQTIGGLGGSLTLGRPSALEIRYQETERVVALPIDPARVTNKGELPYNAAVMASDNPVAVWVFGTVLNYAIGLPENLVADLRPGDRLRLTSDTGSSLSFVVTRVESKSNYEAAGMLTQNRVGMTLFALPASSAEAVPVVQAAYDLTGEDAQTAVYRQVGQPFYVNSPLRISEVVYSDSRTGELLVEIRGEGVGTGMLALHSRSHQTPAIPLSGEASWQLSFLLPGHSGGERITAVYRELLAGESAFIHLGEAPRLAEQLEVEDLSAIWQAERGEAVVVAMVYNPGPGAVRLPGDYLRVIRQGGDAFESRGVSSGVMERFIEAGERAEVRLVFPHPGVETPFVVQVGQWLWGADGEGGK